MDNAKTELFSGVLRWLMVGQGRGAVHSVQVATHGNPELTLPLIPLITTIKPAVFGLLQVQVTLAQILVSPCQADESTLARQRSVTLPWAATSHKRVRNQRS